MKTILPKSVTLGDLLKFAQEFAGADNVTLEEIPDVMWKASLAGELASEFLSRVILEMPENPGVANDLHNAKKAIARLELENKELIKSINPDSVYQMTENAKQLNALRQEVKDLNCEDHFLRQELAKSLGRIKLEIGVDYIATKQYRALIQQAYAVDYLVLCPAIKRGVPVAVPDDVEKVLDIVFHVDGTSLTIACKQVAEMLGKEHPSDGINKTKLFDVGGWEIKHNT